MLTIEEFIANLKGTEWQEVECKIVSIENWQSVEEYVVKCFEKPNDARLVINELLLNALTATAGLDSETKTNIMQEDTFAGVIKERLESNEKFVTLKLVRNSDTIDIVITDMGGPSDFDIQKYLEHAKNNTKSLEQHGRGLLLVSRLVSAGKQFMPDDKLTVTRVIDSKNALTVGTQVTAAMNIAPALVSTPRSIETNQTPKPKDSQHKKQLFNKNNLANLTN